MTGIVLFSDPGGQCWGYEVSGHSGYAEAGKDIVCAALSFLSVTCANALESVAGIVPELTQREGFLKLLVPRDRRNPKAQVILSLFQQGARDLEASYPGHVRVRQREYPSNTEVTP